jgi:hypothetical protein
LGFEEEVEAHSRVRGLTSSDEASPSWRQRVGRAHPPPNWPLLLFALAALSL